MLYEIKITQDMVDIDNEIKDRLVGTYVYSKRIKYYADYIYRVDRLIDMKAKINKNDKYAYKIIEVYGYPPLAGFKADKKLHLITLGRGINLDKFERLRKVYVFSDRHKILECKHVFTEHILFLSLIRKDLDLNSNDWLVMCNNGYESHLVAITLTNSIKSKLIELRVYTKI
ncbi:MAG: hypothetical protein QW607_06210 [Desulfurococcaceae archaeon]